MIIGFDASRAFVSEPTGTENYSLELLKALLKIDKKNFYRIYVNPYRMNSVSRKTRQVSGSASQRVSLSENQKSDTLTSRIAEALEHRFTDSSEFSGNFEVRLISWPRLWTQGGLAWECLTNPPDVLFVPAHTLPLIRRPNLKTMVTIHDLGVEYLPQYHQFPQKYYLNWSTIYAVKNADRIIAVSQNTRKDLVTKLHCDIEVIRVIYEGVRYKNQNSTLRLPSTTLRTSRSGREGKSQN